MEAWNATDFEPREQNNQFCTEVEEGKKEKILILVETLPLYTHDLDV